jgi:23S rRNA (cytosine1962-C5)-methyltransferase
MQLGKIPSKLQIQFYLFESNLVLIVLIKNRIMKLIQPAGFNDYELLDCGDYEKLERFGNFILIRPESQAVWPRNEPYQLWLKQASAHFKRNILKPITQTSKSENEGWKKLRPMPDNWIINCPLLNGSFKLKLSMTAFGHVGIFPEQADNWAYIYQCIKIIKVEKPQVLNLFAYTGGASMAAAMAGAEVTHLDAVKQVVNRTKENAELNGLNNIRRIVDDALKYLKREVKRQKIYQGIILDPPAYGRGPDGERWVLSEGINELLKLCSEILDKKNGFLVLNLYSLGFSSIITKNLADYYFNPKVTEFGEFYLQTKAGINLPTGTFARFKYF